MKKLIGIILFFLLLAVPGDSAASTELKPGRLSEKETNNSSLLWEISGGGLEEPSYLFGTLHLVCPGLFAFHEEWINSFKKTEQLVLELDFTDQSMLQEFQLGIFMKNGESLDDLLEARDLELLTNFLADSLDLDINIASTIMPLITATFFFPHLLQCQPMSYDLFLMQMAIESGYPVKGLETGVDQLSFFHAVPYEEQAVSLLDMIRDYSRARSVYNKMAHLYIDQELDLLYDLILEESTGIPDFEKNFLVERNREWIPAIKDLINRRPAFIAVGAGHLPGNGGLLRLLKQEGYDVIPVTAAKPSLPEKGD
jgi:uncharacterized protein